MDGERAVIRGAETSPRRTAASAPYPDPSDLGRVVRVGPAETAPLDHAIGQGKGPTWLAQQHPKVATCADRQRLHIKQYKAWLATKPTR